MSESGWLGESSDDRQNPDWWERRYVEGDAPWDTGQTPPEVVALVASGQLGTGWALDLGCGTGATSQFLAQHGFRVVGLDLSLAALHRAHEAAAEGHLPCYFVRASVADLGFLEIMASLAVDIGCFHSLEPQARTSYIRTLAQRLNRRAHYLLYTFLRSSPASSATSTGPGVSLADIAAFAPWFTLRSAAHGEDRGRSSAWFLMQRA